MGRISVPAKFDPVIRGESMFSDSSGLGIAIYLMGTVHLR